MSVVLNKPEIIFWDQPACLLLELQIICKINIHICNQSCTWYEIGLQTEKAYFSAIASLGLRSETRSFVIYCLAYFQISQCSRSHRNSFN